MMANELDQSASCNFRRFPVEKVIREESVAGDRNNIKSKPQRLKATPLPDHYGATEVVPFPFVQVALEPFPVTFSLTTDAGWPD
jgi:hypothetical protein